MQETGSKELQNEIPLSRKDDQLEIMWETKILV